MPNELDLIENKITDFSTDFFKTILFFLQANTQSLFVSVIHYIVFIIGFAYFFFYSAPRDIFRVVFFIIVLFGALSYFTFNRCFFTSIELNLSGKKNPIQKIVDKFFGKEIEGNVTSKIVLGVSSLILGGILLKDYGIIKLGTE